MKVTAIFDIGKTNKKCFLFDKNYQEVYKNYCRFAERTDEDGFTCDDLPALRDWVTSLFQELLQAEQYDIQALNFSTYGASLVHLDQDGNPVTPLYNYLKPFPESLLQDFHRKYGDPLTFASQTASPPLGMLNAGLQLYWLKYTRPEVFRNIRWSLHLPQYLSFLFTGIPVSEYTSIGCHTGMWDFAAGDYHAWIYAEELDRLLPPIVPTHLSINQPFAGKTIKTGVGIHDSSAALLPYIRADRKPFLLVSTGTWSICLNPFNNEVLTEADLQQDCLNFLRIDGQPVKASRLFLGNEYKLQVKQLHDYFGKDYDYHRTVKFDAEIYARLQGDPQRRFHFASLPSTEDQPVHTELATFVSFEDAFHQLMIELVGLQVAAASRAIGQTLIQKIYIDGGFADNDLFVKLLALHFKDCKLRTTQSPLGSALGAALVLTNEEIGKRFLKKNYALTPA